MMIYRRGWSKTAHNHARARKQRLACRYLGLSADSTDPLNWVGGKVPQPAKAAWVCGKGDSIVVDVDPKTAHPLTLPIILTDTLYMCGGSYVCDGVNGKALDPLYALDTVWIYRGHVYVGDSSAHPELSPPP